MVEDHTELVWRGGTCPCMVWDMVCHCQDSMHGENSSLRPADIRHNNICFRYFKGDIQIASVDGQGTDVFVYLQSLSHLAQENLPVYNAVSSARLQSIATQVPDWTSPDYSY